MTVRSRSRLIPTVCVTSHIFKRLIWTVGCRCFAYKSYITPPVTTQEGDMETPMTSYDVPFLLPKALYSRTMMFMLAWHLMCACCYRATEASRNVSFIASSGPSVHFISVPFSHNKYIHKSRHFVLLDDVLLRKSPFTEVVRYRLVIPSDPQRVVLMSVHDNRMSEHFTFLNTYKKTSR